MSKRAKESEADEPAPDLIRRRHLRFGWWGIAGFALLGLALEGLHGFKVPWYLDPAFETRRLLWRLAHAHGTLLSLLQIGFAATVFIGWQRVSRDLQITSSLMLLAGLLLPLGFFLAGIKVYAGDPGPGILLVPVGAVCLLLAAVRTAWALGRKSSD
ncbi:MAG: hypothetical protein AAGF97_08650 [Planctomycetota bacterium]